MGLIKRPVLVLLSIFMFASITMAVEVAVEVETDESTVIRLPENTTNLKTEQNLKKKKPVSIDMLVAKYQTASEEDAYKIMNQIKLEIARMSQERQANAIGEVRKSVDRKAGKHREKKPHKKQKHKKKRISSKKKKHKQKKSIHRKLKKDKSKIAKTKKRNGHTTRHPDPMSVMNGSFGHSEESREASGKHGDFGGGSDRGFGGGSGRGMGRF